MKKLLISAALACISISSFAYQPGYAYNESTNDKVVIGVACSGMPINSYMHINEKGVYGDSIEYNALYCYHKNLDVSFSDYGGPVINAPYKVVHNVDPKKIAIIHYGHHQDKLLKV